MVQRLAEASVHNPNGSSSQQLSTLHVPGVPNWKYRPEMVVRASSSTGRSLNEVARTPSGFVSNTDAVETGGSRSTGTIEPSGGPLGLESGRAFRVQPAEKAVDAHRRGGVRSTERVAHADVVEALDFFLPWRRAPAALELINRLSDEEIASLPVATRNLLVGAVNGKRYQEQYGAALLRCYRNQTIDPMFQAAQEELINRVVDDLAATGWLRNLEGNWDGASARTRLDRLQRVGEKVAASLGLDDIRFLPLPKHLRAGLWGDALAGQVRLNPDPRMVEHFGFYSSLNKIIHEVVHAQQYDLANRVESGDIDAESPLHAQARAFQLNWGEYLHHSGYLIQPNEVHARRVADHIVGELRRRWE